MNDLVTKSFLNYADLKKQAMADLEQERDIEMGQLDPFTEENRRHFFEEVGVIKTGIESITPLLANLKKLNEETKSPHSANLLRGYRDQMDSDIKTVLKTARTIKARLEALDRNNIANRTVSILYQEGSIYDRERMGVTNGLRNNLRDMMNEFQALRNQILLEHRVYLKRMYYNATGEHATEEKIDEMVSAKEQVMVFAEKGNRFGLESKERNDAVKDLQRSLTELHQVFLDMAVLVDKQGEEMDDIELNVANAREFVNDGTHSLASANSMRRREVNWVYFIWGLVLLLILIGIVLTYT